MALGVMRPQSQDAAFKSISLSIKAASVAPAGIYVSTTGSDTAPGDGTYVNPYATLGKALSVASAGSQIWMRGGTYVCAARITITVSGSAGNTIKIWNYPGESPVMDFATQPTTVNEGIRIESSYIHMKGIEIKNNRSSGVRVIGAGAANNTLELLVAHDNVNVDSNGAGITVDQSGNDNLILNCDSHHNGAAGTTGGDGFSVVSTAATGNVIRYCRCWNNNDDGIDLSWALHVTVEGCWIWYNGYDDSLVKTSGNGEGIKLGLTYPPDSGDHTIINNLMWHNGEDGINNNVAHTICFVYNNTSWDHIESGRYNFNMNAGSDNLAHVLRNNVSFAGNGVSLDTNVVHDHNSWDSGKTVNSADFVSIDFTANTGARQSDGSLPTSTFLHLVGGSDLVDAGVDVGISYNGSAPDMGAYET